MHTFACPHCEKPVTITDEGKVRNQNIICKNNQHHLMYRFQAKMQVVVDRAKGTLVAA